MSAWPRVCEAACLSGRVSATGRAIMQVYQIMEHGIVCQNVCSDTRLFQKTHVCR